MVGINENGNKIVNVSAWATAPTRAHYVSSRCMKSPDSVRNKSVSDDIVHLVLSKDRPLLPYIFMDSSSRRKGWVR